MSLGSSLSKDKLKAYYYLMRFDKPIGTLLLLWPTYWALWLASEGTVSLKLWVIFTLGTIVMRAAGCVINDFADRKVDGHVKRTKNRPLAAGLLSSQEALALFSILLCIALILVLQLNLYAQILSLGAVFLTILYPFMKRYTHFPQIILGAAFSWGMMMAFGAVNSALPISAWLLFFANLSWTVAFDTQYAMVDRDDDIKIGVKSTAIFFGRFDVFAIFIFQFLSMALLLSVGLIYSLSWPYWVALLLASVLFCYHLYLIKSRERDACFRAFRHNNWVGAVIFMGIFLSQLIM
ncbi:4-hydroxybenzoate octaprenyltransferase [Thorsellia kenyensis]|uniref:4-hydroxybenzoate octaprenyltransferase n=1 Tax=Thorsellia kenyensis TaxID=1549888 RepID=A0ABV6CCP6_9GAMM